MLEWLVNLWAIPEDPFFPRPGVQVVVPICYGCTREKLAEAGLVTTGLAARFYRAFGQQGRMVIAYCNSPICFPGSEDVEETFRAAELKRLGVPGDKILHTLCYNSVTEAEAIRDLLKEREIDPTTIVVICTEIHSRSVRYIWRQVFPRTEVIIRLVPGFPDVEPDQPIKLQRGRWRWLLANLARQAALRLLGMDFVRRHIHPVAK